MSAPRIKRPYAGAASDPAQRQITSFFRKTSTDAAAADPPAFSAAALPASVQSNLLTVGMRVRKSVPEGYKTASAAAFATWADYTLPQAAAAAACSTTAPTIHPPITSIHRNPSAVVSSRRELVPFCGLHKVGGLAVQPHEPEPEPIPFFPPDYAAAETTPPPPGLSSSQDTVGDDDIDDELLAPLHRRRALQSQPTRKRTHDDDDDRPDRPVVWRDAWQDGEISPHTTAPPDLDRLLAVPRRPGSRKSARATTAPPPRRENVVVVDASMVAGRGPDDFDEAEFLVFRKSSEEQRDDLEMSGV